MGYINRRFYCYHIAVPGRMMGYINKKSSCCHTVVSSKMIGYMNGRFYYCHTAIPTGMMDYVNKKSRYCHIAIPGEAIKIGKKAQLIECKMIKGVLVGWLVKKRRYKIKKGRLIGC